MYANTIFKQLQDLLPRHDFETLTKQHQGDAYVKKFTCWQHFSVLLYAQASGKDSLRDIEQALQVQMAKLYHLGLEHKICRSTVSDANRNRPYAIAEGLFYHLLTRCKDFTPKHKFKFKNPLYTFDATVIDLCLSMFPWAKFRTRKGALKLHYQFDHAGDVPAFLVVTDGKHHELTVAKESFPLIPDSMYCVDRGYVDFGFFARIEGKKAYFVTRAKENLAYTVTGQQETDGKNGVLSDETILLTQFYAKKDYPKSLRLIHYYDVETDKILIFLTNHFKLAASTIARIYKARWQIEVFFKWIKQNLKIKTFLGTSKNAVLTQIWVAMCYYLLLAYIKYQTRYKNSLFYLHKLIRETLLDRLTLVDLLHLKEKLLPKVKALEHQLVLL